MAAAQERDRVHTEQLPPRERAIALAAARTGGTVRVLLPMVATLMVTATVATVSGLSTPTGTVIFKDGVTALATNTLSAGQATFTTSSLSVARYRSMKRAPLLLDPPRSAILQSPFCSRSVGTSVGNVPANCGVPFTRIWHAKSSTS